MKKTKKGFINNNTWKFSFGFMFMMFLFATIPLAQANTKALSTISPEQQRQKVTGTVTDESGVELIGVSVAIKNTGIGVITDVDGKFEIDAPSDAILVFSYIGYKKQEIAIAGRTVLNVTLNEDTSLLDEIVVTGVAKGTSKEKLAFTVAKVNKEALKEVPGVNVATTLAGKMPGIKVFSASGNPMDEPNIQLRGTMSFSGNTQPLIIVDGIVTSGVLKDINMEDVENIEVIKGAAAASFYGAKAAGGVIQIITKRGSSLGEGTSKVSIKSEIGANWLGFLPTKTTAHGHMLDDAGNPIAGAIKADQIWDNKYIMDHDPYKDLFSPQVFNSSTIGLTGRSKDGDMSYYASMQYTHNPGVIEGLDGVKRTSFRANLDHRLNKMVTFTTSNLYVRTLNDRRTLNFDDIYYADPNANFLANNIDGTPYKVNPNIVSTRNNLNPLYEINNQTKQGTANRYLGNYGLRFIPLDFLTFTANYSMDYFHYQDEDLTPKGRLLVNYPDGSTRDNGYVYRGTGNTFKHNFEVSGLISKTFGDLSASLKLQYLYEDSKSEGFWANGSNLAVSGSNITSLEQANPDTRDHSSWGSRVVNNSYTGILNLDYKDKYIFDALIRRDGASVLGDNNRWHNYFRVSGAWNIIKDINIPNVQLLKPRISYGTAGILPDYGAKYETFSLSNGTLANGLQLGNKNLKASLSQELEVGIDTRFFDRFNLDFTYSYKRNTDLPYVMTVSGVTGFQYQHVNVGEFFVHSYELALNANIIKNKDWSWDATLTWDKMDQYVGELGRPDFFNGMVKVASNDEYGKMYSSKFATSLDQVKTSKLIKPGQSVEDVFTINNYGYVVRKDLIGTRDEAKMSVLDEDGNTSSNEYIGNMFPDFNLNLVNTLTYKNWMLYFTLSWQQGGDLYNNTKLYMSFAGRNAKFWDMSERSWDQKKAMNYSNQHSRYSFTEDASFLKLRELSLNYSITESQFKKWGVKFMKGMKIGAVARNLFTFTKYSGPDPETRTSEGGTLVSTDTPKYPSDIRTLTGTITIDF